MVPPIDQSKVIGSTVHSKAIHVTADVKFNMLYGSQKKVDMVEGVVINVYQKIMKKSRKQFYFIADYKKPGGSIKRARLHMYMVAGPVLVPVLVNLPTIAPILTSATTTIVPANPSTSVPENHYTLVDPAPVPTTTNTTVAPALLPTTNNVPSTAPDPTITTTIPSNSPTHFVPEPDTTTTTSIYDNHHTQNPPVPDTTSYFTPVSTVPNTPSPTNSTRMAISDCRGFKWYYLEYLIYLDEVPSLQ